jgi:hypothetical protein
MAKDDTGRIQPLRILVVLGGNDNGAGSRQHDRDFFTAGSDWVLDNLYGDFHGQLDGSYLHRVSGRWDNGRNDEPIHHREPTKGN